MPNRSIRSVALAIGALACTGFAAPQPQAKAIQVTIDVKPGDTPTTLEPKREGMVPIAILSSKQFDATKVDPASIRAGAEGTEASIFRSALEDVDNDRDTDMMLLFRVVELRLSCGGKSVTVRGKTVDGQNFEGTEMVTMTGCD